MYDFQLKISNGKCKMLLPFNEEECYVHWVFCPFRTQCYRCENSAFGQEPAFSAPKDKKSDLLQPEEVIGYFAEFFDILVIISRHHNVFVFLLKRFEPV